MCGNLSLSEVADEAVISMPVHDLELDDRCLAPISGHSTMIWVRPCPKRHFQGSSCVRAGVFEDATGSPLRCCPQLSRGSGVKFQCHVNGD